jgi:hypothetical protein
VTAETITDEQIRHSPHQAQRRRAAVKPVTAETITNKQIRELRNENLGSNSESTEFVTMCHTALGLYEGLTVEEVRNARKGCAAAWNTRHGVKT